MKLKTILPGLLLLLITLTGCEQAQDDFKNNHEDDLKYNHGHSH